MRRSSVVVTGALLATASLYGQGQRIRPIPNTCAGVVKHQGTPIEGASLHFVWLAHPELPPPLGLTIDPQPVRRLAAKSRAKGRFRVSLPHRGPFAVFARHAKLRSPLLFPVFAGDYLTLKLKTTQFLTGSVRDSTGAAVVGAAVAKARSATHASLPRLDHNPRPVDIVRTDQEGRFRLPVWPVGDRVTDEPRSLRAWNKKLVSQDAFYLNTGQSTDQIELTLSRSTTIRGVVMTVDNRPLAGARIWDAIDTGRSVRSDQQGAFVFAGATVHRLVVEAKGYRRRTIARGGEVKLQRGLRISMRLLHDQRPLSGHRVVMAAPIDLGLSLPWLTRVGENGQVVLDGVTPKVPLSGFVELQGKFVQFLCCVPTENQDLGEIHVTTSRIIRGQVQDARRQPIAGAKVMLQPRLLAQQYAALGSVRRPTQQVLSRVAYTDRGGRYAFAVALPGPAILAVNAGAGGFHTERIQASQQGSLVLTIPKGIQVSGQAVLPSDKPAAHAHIQYIFLGGGDAPRFATQNGRCYLHLVTDATGKFTIRGLPSHGSYTSYALHSEAGVGMRSVLTGTVSKTDKFEIQHALKPHPARN